MVGGPDGKGMDCNSIALQSSVFDSRTDLQKESMFGRLRRVGALG